MVPLLYIIFNRPDLTRQSFERLRRLRPPVLYIAADGPRPNRPGERQRCEETRDLTECVDWPCEVVRLYSDANMGCGPRIASAITRILDDHDRAIIMEDDCIADPSFFAFCQTLLNRYASDDRVMAISGDNFQGGVSRTPDSYYFSKYPHCWGWATWRRAWQHFDLSISAWPSIRERGDLHSFCRTDREVDYWTEMFDMCHDGRINTWDFPWTLACWLQNGLTILPDQNLVTNIGFGEDGTHTMSDSPFANLPTSAIGTLNHPAHVYANDAADQHTDELVYSGPWSFAKRRRQKWFSSRRIKAQLRRIAA